MNSKLTLQPSDKNERALELRHSSLSAPVLLQMWESMYYLNWAQKGWRMVGGRPGPFTPTGNGGWRRELRSEDGVLVQFELEPRGEAIAVSISVTNITHEIMDPFWGEFVLGDVWFDLCAHFRDVKELYDPDFGRVFASVNGTPTPLNQTSLTGFRQAIQSYWPKGQQRRLDRLPDNFYTYGTNISDSQLDDTWLAVESREGQFTLLAMYERVNVLTANRREPFHGCIHVDPLLGDIPIGQTASMKGAVVLAQCPLGEAIRRGKELLR